MLHSMPPPIPITPQVVGGRGEEREGERQRKKGRNRKGKNTTS